jgi:hypothetical protein
VQSPMQKIEVGLPTEMLFIGSRTAPLLTGKLRSSQNSAFWYVQKSHAKSVIGNVEEQQSRVTRVSVRYGKRKFAI